MGNLSFCAEWTAYFKIIIHSWAESTGEIINFGHNEHILYFWTDWPLDTMKHCQSKYSPSPASVSASFSSVPVVSFRFLFPPRPVSFYSRLGCRWRPCAPSHSVTSAASASSSTSPTLLTHSYCHGIVSLQSSSLQNNRPLCPWKGIDSYMQINP